MKIATRRGIAMALVAQLALVGCVSSGGGGGRTLEVGDEKSFDGLLKVTNSRASVVWVYPDFDLSGYTRIRLTEPGIELRPVRNRRSSSRSVGEGQPMSETAQKRLVTILREAFEKELARSTLFELTDEVGPEVLTVWGGLIDVVSFVPPQRMGRDDVFLRRIGEATLVLELRDSESNATLVRIMDRRAAERRGAVVPSNPVSNASETRRLANTWARLFRQRLDELPTLSHGTDSE